MSRLQDRDIAQWALKLGSEIYGDAPISLAGDLPGHEFRGNQYTDHAGADAAGAGGADTVPDQALRGDKYTDTATLADTPENRKLAGDRCRAFIDKYLHPGVNPVTVAMTKHFDVNQGFLVKHRGEGDHPEMKGRKTAELYPKGVVRLTTMDAKIGFNYERNVQAQQAREGKDATFKAGPIAGGAIQHDEDVPAIVRHENGKEFLQLRPTGKGWKTEIWIDAATKRHLSEAEMKDVKKNLVSSKKGEPGEDAQDGIDKPIPIIGMSMTNVYMLKGKNEDGWHKINKMAFENHPEGTKLSREVTPHSRMVAAIRTALGIGSDLELAREDDLVLGDTPGHPFRGNQYGDGVSMAPDKGGEYGGSGGAAPAREAAAPAREAAAPAREAAAPARPWKVPNQRDMIEKMGGRAFDRAWSHEKMRINTMDDAALERRIGKIKDINKLAMYGLALEDENHHRTAARAFSRHAELFRAANPAPAAPAAAPAAPAHKEAPAAHAASKQGRNGDMTHDEAARAARAAEARYHDAAKAHKTAEKAAVNSADHAAAHKKLKSAAEKFGQLAAYHEGRKNEGKGYNVNKSPVAKTANEGNGAHGGFYRDAEDHGIPEEQRGRYAETRFHEAVRAIEHKYKVTPEVARNYLDSKAGRHVVDAMTDRPPKDLHQAMKYVHSGDKGVKKELEAIKKATAEGAFQPADYDATAPARLSRGDLVLGDSPGHPFRGNQYQPGGEERNDEKNSEQNFHSAAGEAAKAAREAKSPEDHAHAAEVHKHAADMADRFGLPNQGSQLRRQAEAHEQHAHDKDSFIPQHDDPNWARSEAAASPVVADAERRANLVDPERSKRMDELFKNSGIRSEVDQGARAKLDDLERKISSTPKHDDPIYRKTQKLPKYNGEVNPLTAGYGAAGRMLRQRMPGVSKEARDERGRFSSAEAQDMSDEAREASSNARDSVVKHNKAIGLNKQAAEAHRSVAADMRENAAGTVEAKFHDDVAKQHDDKIKEHEHKISKIQSRQGNARERNAVMRDSGLKRTRSGGWE